MFAAATSTVSGALRTAARQLSTTAAVSLGVNFFGSEPHESVRDTDEPHQSNAIELISCLACYVRRAMRRFALSEERVGLVNQCRCC